MKFLIVSHHTPWTIGASCKRALEQLGCQADIFYLNASTNIAEKAINGIRSHVRIIRPYLDSYWEELINKKLIKKVRDFKPDILLVIRGEELYPETLRRIKHEHSLCLITWWTEPRLEHKYYLCSLPTFDYVFTFEKEHISKMKECGARRVYYLPLACDPFIHRPITLNTDQKQHYEHDVSFCGAINPARIDIFKEISHLDFVIWGRDWRGIVNKEGLQKNFKYEIRGEDVAKVYSASKIGLNVHHADTLSGLNARTYEIPACGTLEIMDYKSAVEEHFHIGKEIICYKDKRELPGLIAYYLSNSQERSAIVENGCSRVHREHRYIDRMRYMLSVIK
jgi:spore maturation protein CgeB